MQNNCKALYNSLRLNWLLDNSGSFDTWQVEDYRKLTLEEITARLQQFDIQLSKESFLSLTENYDTPEEFSEDLFADFNATQSEEDQIFLLIFELWRRLLPYKPSISIFCDELDYHIHLFDQNEQEDLVLQDLIANLKEILDENVDDGTDPVEAFLTLAECCANDLPSFLYDYISLEIDSDNFSYANDLIDNFYDYQPDKKWFDFLKVKISAPLDTELANQQLSEIIEETHQDEELDFNLEVLEFLSQFGSSSLFRTALAHTLPLVETEEDFQVTLTLIIRYFHFIDSSAEEQRIDKILKSRHQIPLSKPIQKK